MAGVRMLTRRTLFAAASAIAARTQKGPKVFLDYDQAELDAAYNQSGYARNGAEVQRRYVSNSELTRARLGSPMRLAYGPGDIEKLDLFRGGTRNAPVHVFIHGGAWR